MIPHITEVLSNNVVDFHYTGTFKKDDAITVVKPF